MKRSLLMLLVISTSVCLLLASCSKPVPVAEAAEAPMTTEEYVLQGKYLVEVAGCSDCHSPKIFNENGMQVDESRLLSGHPNGSTLPPIDEKALEPGNWALFSGDLTVGVGPWGMTYARNLTPHETGIKGWTEEVFIKAMRTGKHMGVEQGRPILPPMPWFNLAKATDEDLKAIYRYLQSIPPIDNRVPAPKSPDEVRAMIAEQGV